MFGLALQGRFRQNSRILTDIAGSFQKRPTHMSDVPESERGGEIRFTVSPQQWAYLGWLVRNTVLGRSENDIARHVLTQRLSEMRGEKFEDGQRT
jgi:hypothetical protein